MSASFKSYRTLVHYAFALGVITFYGVQVCPFLEELGPLELALPVSVVVTIQYALHLFLIKEKLDRVPYKEQVHVLFQWQLLLFVGSGLAIALFNYLYYDFPIASGMKLILGFTTIGFFVAADLALERERWLAIYLSQKGVSLKPDRRFISLAKVFALFATFSAIFLVVIFFLLINKDLDWLQDVGQSIPFTSAQRSIVIEFMFVGLIFLAYILLVISAFSKNLNLFFGRQNRVLQAATAGDLQTTVTVSSNDEFGVMAHHTNVMIKRLYDSTDELKRTRDITIYSLASLAETRDNETGAHILRTQRYVRALAKHLQGDAQYTKYLSDERIDLLYKSAPLHDIGKVGIPDAILLKPAKLTDEEFEIMKTHTTLGGEALTRAELNMGQCSFLYIAREIALNHHEKWDGSGYPQGLKGDAIPLSGRLMAVADVYDALISKRVYKAAFSHEKAMDIILEGKGSHFDPGVIEALCAIEDEFKVIANKYRDGRIGF